MINGIQVLKKKKKIKEVVRDARQGKCQNEYDKETIPQKTKGAMKNSESLQKNYAETKRENISSSRYNKE